MNISNEILSGKSIWDESSFSSLRKYVGNSPTMIVALIHLGLLLKQTGDKQLFGPHGLTTESYELLFMTRDNTHLRPIDIANCTLMHPAKITRIIDLLIDKDYIKRVYDSDDRRSYYLNITDSGHNILNKCDTSFKSYISNFDNLLDDKQYEWLMNILYTMINMNKNILK